MEIAGGHLGGCLSYIPGLKCFIGTGSVRRGAGGWVGGDTHSTEFDLFRSPGKCDGGPTGLAHREDPTPLIH